MDEVDAAMIIEHLSPALLSSVRHPGGGQRGGLIYMRHPPIPHWRRMHVIRMYGILGMEASDRKSDLATAALPPSPIDARPHESSDGLLLYWEPSLGADVVALVL